MPANRDGRGDAQWRIVGTDGPDGGDPVRPSALLVDDNSEVLVTIGAFLAAAGFDVVRARNGDEALAHLASGRMFVLMVRIGGVDLAAQARDRLPALKILIITGFPSDAGLFDRPPGVALLAKPFRRAGLIAAVRSLFEAATKIQQEPTD